MQERNIRQVGDYRLIQLLGSETAIDVYLSEHIFLKTLATLKLLREPLRTEQAKEASLQVARSMAGLVHRNIVRVLDFGVQDGTFFLATEYIWGETLRQSYPADARFDPISMLILIKPLASALQYAHDQQCIHGSITPENILLSSDNEVLFSDFGMFTLLQNIGSYHMSPNAYTAPEQLDGALLPASDQYALAVIASELLHGKLPSYNDPAATSGRVADVDEVLQMALAQDPSRRFGTIKAFSTALEQACGEMPEESVPFASSNGLAAHSSVNTQPVPYTTSQLQEQTRASTYLYPKESLASMDSVQTSIQPGSFQATPTTYKKDPSRRRFLIGAGIGVGVLGLGGIVTALAASGKLTPLFPGFSPTHTAFTGPSGGPPPTITPAATVTPTEAIPTDTPTLTPSMPIGTTLVTYTGQSGDVTGVCWSPTASSGLIASCDQNGIASIWSATSGLPARIFPKSGPLNTLLWSPDGQYLAIADGNNIDVWNGDGTSLISTCTGHSKIILGLSWSHDSQRFVSSSQDQTAIIWNAASGSQLLTYRGHSQYVWSVAWAPNGSAIATGGWDNTVQVWNPDSGSLIFRYPTTQPVRTVDWSPDSTLIASGGDDNIVQVWQAANGTNLSTYKHHSNHIETVQWSPDGQFLASASKDATVQIWQPTTARQIYTYTGHSKLVWTLAWSPNSQMIVSGSQDQTVKVWQAV